ncbi:DoxX family protein [Flavobacterium sp. SLB02]|uniref:DoxX family protein n=1 Tax=Flavobacterium sp. SLB02 TaxID=2665645 RepID=UPI0012AA475C|nr:MauE/DoxX family redox-associated membrane protein [Flavobacterium sp. SLB02]QGK73181.1 hypothetical protein GIY83_03615 [Flavobacterium sp. SLB02]
MKTSVHIKRILVDCICLLYGLLFVYASVSKLLDFERFQVQLAQSPLLSAYAWWISWMVISIELFIALLLLYKRTRTIALFAALSLMSMFTAYIFIILHYSSFIPCSCGGILEKMSWDVHLIFNLVFVLLAIVALLLIAKQDGLMKRRLPIYAGGIAFLIVGSVSLVVVLFLSSEEIIHRKNPFIRRYPQSSIKEVQQVDLKFNSYYFAGAVGDVIYLGNSTDPLHLLAIDLQGRQKRIRLHFDHKNLGFQSIRIAIREEYIYLMDGTVPCIFRGNTKDWSITTQLKGMPRFTLAQPLDSTTIAFRNNTGANRAHILGVFYAGTSPKVDYAPWLLTPQIDGIFDTDGMLQYNAEMKILLYNYFYRNQFIVADTKGNLKFTGHTIDTITKAKIKVAYLKGNTERQMAAPPFMVNAMTATKKHLLFVYSKVPGRYDSEKVWQQSSIIDVYDLKKKSYVLSFPVYGNENKKIQALWVSSSHLYVIIDAELIIYKISGLLEKEMNKA